MAEQHAITRADHLAWCKQRALEYVDVGDLQQAFVSMTSDLGKHKETIDHIGIRLGLTLMVSGKLGIPREMRKFIEGFN